VGDTGLTQAENTLLAAEPMAATTAPDFTLTDQRGSSSSLTRFRGRAVVLSFNDDRCTDICTLLAQDVVAADHDLGANRGHVAFVSVNANPYFSSPQDVRQWSDRHGLGSVSNWTYETGDQARLEAAWRAYGEQVRLSPKARTVEHGTELVFIDPSGHERLIGMYGTDSADTAAFAHALADAAVSLLPAADRHPVAGSVSGGGTSGADAGPRSPLRLPELGDLHASVAIGEHHYTVVTFFSSTCTVCAAELPGIEREYTATRGHVAYVGVDVADQSSSAEQLIKQAGVTYPIAVDTTGSAAAAYHVTGLPYTVILDPSGRTVTSHPGLLTTEQLDYLLRVLPNS
jgi:cytochrome oxidase Cu insertion factor (SCO1/SenC/PrrC family)/thiol-disulfide isomerase/thioredoxin